MSRLDDAIADVSFIFESLKELKYIYNTGKDCNTCKKKDCEYRAEWGKTVRFNCPLWEGDRSEYTSE